MFIFFVEEVSYESFLYPGHLLLYQVLHYSLTEKHLNRKHLPVIKTLKLLFLEIN